MQVKANSISFRSFGMLLADTFGMTWLGMTLTLSSFGGLIYIYIYNTSIYINIYIYINIKCFCLKH